MEDDAMAAPTKHPDGLPERATPTAVAEAGGGR